MNRVDRMLQRIVLSYSSVPRPRQSRERPELVHPGDRRVAPRVKQIVGYVMALVFPAAVAAVMIPLRTDHAAAASLVMVVPVVLVAAVGGTGPAIVAAAAASLAFDLFLTEPYYRLTISDPDDIAASLALGVVGLIVGVLSSRLGHLVASDDARRDELAHLVRFFGEVDDTESVEELSELACGHLIGLLGLRRCEWLPHAHDTSGPVLLPAGTLMGRLEDMDPDRGKLPHHVELPVVVDGRQRGCFLMTSDQHRLTSVEERRTAATIGAIFGRSMHLLSGRSTGAGVTSS